ncbi:MAG: heme-binding protein [Acidobacteriia bacterium]|nr:heme-binding protein [Terriglobia bacterium]
MPARIWDWKLALALCLAALLLSCGSNGGGSLSFPVPPPLPPQTLTLADVQSVVQNAVQSVDAPFAVAVTDRSGNILAVFQKPGTPPTSIGNFSAVVDTNELAVSLARTGAFFSNNQAPLSSRTVRFISGTHFPPGIQFVANGALYGIENTNRGCPLNIPYLPGQSLPPARSISGAALGLGIATGKVDVNDSDQTAVDPGGVPLFKNGVLVGGVGVAGVAPNVAEFAAFSGAVGAGFGPNPAPPGVVVIDGVSLPFVNQTTRPVGSNPGTIVGGYVVGPIASPGPPPEGGLMAPQPGPIGGLTAAEVQSIITNAVDTASITRAVIRLPLGSRARMAIAVADLDGTIIGLHRMPDSTVFSIDVAVAKARNMVYFNSPAGIGDLPGIPPGTASTNRTISFGAQPFFPPGIDGSGPGPFFFSLYQFDVANPCTQGSQPPGPNQSGIVFFPGSVPLYRDGVLVGGLGISGDGVEQDDFVANGGSLGFEAPLNIRADQVFINGVRMPYLKFPRNPAQ